MTPSLLDTNDTLTDTASPQLRQSWLDCIRNDVRGSIYLHPDLVARLENPSIYARWEREPHRLAALAVLAHKTMKMRPLPGLNWGWSLRGRRLVGDQILGDDGRPSAEAFVRSVVRSLSAGETQFVFFEDLEVGTDLFEAIVAAGKRGEAAVSYPGEAQPHWSIEFPNPAADYFKKLSKNARHHFRARLKKLEHTLVCYRDKPRIGEFLERAHQVSLKSWQTKRMGLRIGNTAAEKRFWETAADLGAMRNYILESDGKPLAFMTALQWQGRFVSEEIGYDADYADLAPGSVLHYRVLEDLVAHDTPRVFDFGYGDNQYKRASSTRQTTSGPVMILRRGLGPMTALRADALRRKAEQGFRAALKRLGLLQRVHQLYRH